MSEIPLRENYFVDGNNTRDCEQLASLVKSGFIETIDDEVVYCRKCNNCLLLDDEFRQKGSKECSVCSKLVGIPSKPASRIRISEIHYSKIIQYLHTVLERTFEGKNLSYDSERRLWVVKRNDKQLVVCLSGVSISTFFDSIAPAEGIHFYLEGDRINGNLPETSRGHFVYFYDDITRNKEALLQFADSLDYRQTMDYLGMTEKFENFLHTVTPQDFEKKFIPSFIGGIKVRHKELESLYAKLTVAKNTLLNSKFASIGGPSQEDFILIDLLEYLQAGLVPARFGEAKRYRTTQFTASDFGLALAHSLEADTLFIVSTNRIQPEVWAIVFDTRQKFRYYKHVILDKDLIQFLIYNLGMNYLIESTKPA